MSSDADKSVGANPYDAAGGTVRNRTPAPGTGQGKTKTTDGKENPTGNIPLGEPKKVTSLHFIPVSPENVLNLFVLYPDGLNIGEVQSLMGFHRGNSNYTSKRRQISITVFDLEMCGLLKKVGRRWIRTYKPIRRDRR